MRAWAVITGDGNSNKRGVVRDVAEKLRARGLSVGGFIEQPVEKDGAPIGFDLLDLASGRTVPLARQVTDPSVCQTCQLSFDPQAFLVARGWIEEGGHDVVVAEVGKLESAGEGHWPAVCAIEAPLTLLYGRPDRVAPIALRVHDPVAGLELPADASALGDFVDSVERAARAHSST